MAKIYKITKSSDPMTVYIGKTNQSDKKRMSGHKFEAKRSPNRKLSQWFDETCVLDFIEICNINPGLREMEIIQEYITNGYDVMNELVGKHMLDPISNRNKIQSKYNSKVNSINNHKRHPAYIKWFSKISYKAKKESLTTHEYRIKYSIPDYNGPKTK